MSDKSIFELQADVCKVLGNPIRLEIIEILKEKELSFTQLLDITGVLKSNLSQNLSLMTEKGILKVRRSGQNNYYSLSSVKITKACQLMREILTENLKKQAELIECLINK